jgi:hypothetical protein
MQVVGSSVLHWFPCGMIAEAALRNNGSFIKLRAVGSAHAKATAIGNPL